MLSAYKQIQNDNLLIDSLRTTVFYYLCAVMNIFKKEVCQRIEGNFYHYLISCIH